MGFLRRNNNDKPDYTSLQIQTSTSTLPIPIVWGRNKIAPNLIWYANFRAVPGGRRQGNWRQGRPVWRRPGAATYTYTADLIMALCEGPIAGVGLDLERPVHLRPARARNWHLQRHDAARSFGLILRSCIPYNALAYQGTAIAWAAGYNLGVRDDRQSQFRDHRPALLELGSTASTPTLRLSSKTF